MADAPAVVVELNFGVAEADDFILDDATRGRLDGSTYVLADGFSEATGDATSVQIQRGRFSELFEAFNAGSASIVLNNDDRAYDPQYSSSPYFGYIIPGRTVRVKAGGEPLFVGKVEDWDFEYDPGYKSVSTMAATDALGGFGYQSLRGFTGAAGQLPGARIIDVLNDVAWPLADTDIDIGVSTLQGDTPDDGTNALGYLQTVARSDIGYLYAARDGKITFRDRHHVVNSAASQCSFGTGGVPIQQITVKYGTEQLYSTVTVTNVGGTAQTVTVADLQGFVETYGVPRSLAVSGLVLETDAQAMQLAQYLLGLFDAPEYRIDSITLQLHGMTSGQQADVLALDIGSLVDVTFTPDGIGSAIAQDLIIQGIRHQIAPMFHLVTLAFVSAADRAFFQLDSSAYGVLDANALGM